jgi:capsular polysaccharide biosynthesis protein
MNASDRPQGEPSVREQLVAIGDFFRRALRFWHVLLVSVLLGAAAFAVFYYLHQPRFRSETVVLYVQKGGPEENADSSETQRSVALRLKELLVSRPNLERVISRFNLYPAVRQRYGIVDAVEELKKHIDFRAPGGDTFSIAFEGDSAKQAQAVTAELTRQVLEGDAQLRKDQAKVALDFLVGERKARDAELREAEEKLAAFMAQHPRFALDATPLANGAAIRASMGAAAAVAGPPAGVAWAPRGASSPSLVTPRLGAAPSAPSPDEARARAALAAARESLTEKLAHYTPAHPDVRAAEGEVQRATERLAAVVSAAPRAAPIETATPQQEPAPSASARAIAVPARVAPPTPPKAESPQNLVELEVEWLKLTRAVTEARQRQDQIEGQLFRADIQASSETGGHGVQVNVIDPAFLPQTPLPPGRTTLALIFVAASLVLGVTGALIFAIFDERLFSSRDFAAVGGVLVEVPKHVARRADARS